MLMMLALFGLWLIRGTADADDAGLVWWVIGGAADADDAGLVWLVGDSSDG